SFQLSVDVKILVSAPPGVDSSTESGFTSRFGSREPHQRKPFTYWLQPRPDLHTIIQSANQKLRRKPRRVETASRLV
ncbi:hypothetical protein DPX16_18965, partial [Anabarilius grahami]